MNEIKVYFDFLVFLVRLYASAEQVHDAAQRPTVDVEVRGNTSPCLWCAPLFETSSSCDPRICVLKHHCDIEVDYINLVTPWASLEYLPFLFKSTYLVLDQNVVRLQVSVTDAVPVEILNCLE